MEQHHKEHVEELISNMECVHDFRCYKNNFESCCHAQTIENADGIIQCGNGCKQADSDCQYGHKMNGDTLCTCALRVYAARYNLDGNSTVSQNLCKSTV